ncbi:hypothetical protein [Brevibacillus laterosporus]|uniref:Uncharacterized protein n=1 Tax=Brevibacillus laterosporus TaxID=1465 RepID=A0AAP3GAR4_BRELA|nr:hypothetical protein [Brevibacillus laterosporus]MCR8978704.1 hypothetical protein [Brevibacillus laterosporus]MCZ0805860.1 hypothetical protein [Brevibacillus laterosporus]MCZ0824374.1 hypothetical protein [Brevibacillus laterosporus]MCZ0848278.1 hypothetical protein [Brevibacillus laterosporus]
MDIDDLFVKVVDNGHSIIAQKGNRRHVYTKEYLTKCWLTMSNDCFFNMFGFNWVPPTSLQDRVRKTL